MAAESLFSDRFKHAFKVALAMVITYGIAMYMAWEKPFWAALSVIFCSLATSGESIDRGIQRVLGTVLAGAMALILVALFPQDRWLFLLSMSAFIAVCTYVWAGGSRYNFIWFNAGFNFPIVALLGEGLSVTTFDMVVLRAQETALGVVVYSLVAVLVWPRRGGAAFRQAIVGVCESELGLFRSYVAAMAGRPDGGDPAKLRAAVGGLLPGLGAKLEGAAYDSAEISAQRRAWRRCIKDLAGLHDALGHWQAGMPGLRDLDLQRIFPGLAGFAAEIESRLSAVLSMLSGQPPQGQPRDVPLHGDRDALGELSHGQRAAVVSCRDHLARIDRLTASLLDTVSDIGDFQVGGHMDRRGDAAAPVWTIDVDRLLAAVRQSSVLWLLLLLSIYLTPFPNVVGTLALGNAFAMAFAVAPFVQARVLLQPALLATVFAGLVYMLVMPHLAGFAQLGAMIFSATLVISYVYYRAEDFPARAMGLTMLVIVIGADNEQTYSFLYFANWLIAAIFFVLAMEVGWRFPVSFRPEVRFTAMLRRFFSSTGLLLSDLSLSRGPEQSRRWRWRRAFHVHQVTVLPTRLQGWAATLPAQALGEGGHERIQDLMTSVGAISDRMQALMQAEPEARSGAWPEELLEVIEEWRGTARDAFGELSARPPETDLAVFRTRLQDEMARLEIRARNALDDIGPKLESGAQGEELYRVLGACRGLSGSLMELTDRILAIEWSLLQEARF